MEVEPQLKGNCHLYLNNPVHRNTIIYVWKAKGVMLPGIGTRLARACQSRREVRVELSKSVTTLYIVPEGCAWQGLTRKHYHSYPSLFISMQHPTFPNNNNNECVVHSSKIDSMCVIQAWSICKLIPGYVGGIRGWVFHSLYNPDQCTHNNIIIYYILWSTFVEE